MGVGPGDGVGIQLLRRDGAIAVTCGIGMDDSAGIRVHHSNSLPAFSAMVDAAGNVRVEIYDANGKCLWPSHEMS